MKLALVAGTAASLLGSGCADLDETASPDAVLLLTATPRSIGADGFSTATVVAELDTRTAARYRDVSFSTTLGRFVGGSSTTDQTLVVAADSSGRATATLRSGTQAGTAVVTAEIRDGTTVLVTRSLEVPFERVPASNVLTLSLGQAEAPADGASVTDVVVRIATPLIQTERTVTFSTTAGSFGAASVQSTQVRAGTDDIAATGLVSPREMGSAVVTATLNDVSVRGTVEFVAAVPESATLSVTGSFRLAATFSTKSSLRLALFRSTGTVSRGTEAEFEAVDESSKRAFGFFSGVTPSDASGVITADFTPGNTTERGEATLSARIPGTRVSATVRIEVVDP
jgi:adhesin/invasin